LGKKDREALMTIFREVSDEPDWQDNSVLYEMYKKRIPVTEFIMLLNDPEWAFIADKK
jgi:hypothetical protein